MANGTGRLTGTESQLIMGGFPFVNYGVDRYATDRPLYIPRPKYTWFAELDINQDYLKSGRLSTNLDTFLDNNNNKLYLHLKRIDHPKPTVNTETLRSYNKYVKVPTKVEYPPAQMTFDDDATSIVMALWKEYLAFYSHVGDVGYKRLLQAENLVSADEDTALANDKQLDAHAYGHLVSVDGTEPRVDMEERASLGMRLKSNNHRHFFDRIVIYDLGTERESVNIYYYFRPVITAWDHGDLDWEDRTGKVEVNATFEYENYYFALGRRRGQVADVIERMTGFRPADTPAFDDIPGQNVSVMHGDMKAPQFPTLTNSSSQTDFPTLDVLPDVNFSGVTAPTFREPQTVSRELDSIEEQIVLNQFRCDRNPDAGGCPPPIPSARIRQRALQRELELSRRETELQRQREQNDPKTQSALGNTLRKFFGG